MPPAFVEFVEDKSVSAERLHAALRPAIAQNRHSNFGPVSEMLETELATLNGNTPLRAARMTANATLGLQAAVAVFDNARGTRLRWATCDFGFFTSFTGPFHDQTLVPCQGDGQISLTALDQLPLADYDAILATNVFGLNEEFEALFDFARSRDKVLLIDNAAGFTALAPRHAASAPDDPLLWAEVVSFHHTKPWGMGEGGAVFGPTALLGLLRAAINFGLGGGRQLADLRFCTNAKMSEIAAAQILLRVRDHEIWAPAYRAQARRVLDLGRAAGLQPVVPDLPQRAVPGQIAFRCSDPITLEQLDNPRFRALKYYRPSPRSGTVAHDLFDHVVNVPCHPGMAALKDVEILEVLGRIRGAP